MFVYTHIYVSEREMNEHVIHVIPFCHSLHMEAKGQIKRSKFCPSTHLFITDSFLVLFVINLCLSLRGFSCGSEI